MEHLPNTTDTQVRQHPSVGGEPHAGVVRFTRCTRLCVFMRALSNLACIRKELYTYYLIDDQDEHEWS